MFQKYTYIQTHICTYRGRLCSRSFLWLFFLLLFSLFCCCYCCSCSCCYCSCSVVFFFSSSSSFSFWFNSTLAVYVAKSQLLQVALTLGMFAVCQIYADDVRTKWKCFLINQSMDICSPMEIVFAILMNLLNANEFHPPHQMPNWMIHRLSQSVFSCCHLFSVYIHILLFVELLAIAVNRRKTRLNPIIVFSHCVSAIYIVLACFFPFSL